MIVVVGYATRDIVVTLPRLPVAGQRVQAEALEVTPGGMAANVAAAAAAFGATVSFVGSVGPRGGADDPLADLQTLGVDVSSTATDAHTATCVILLTPDGDRAIISQDDTVGRAQIAEGLRLLEVGGGGLLYVDGYRWPWAAEPLAGHRREIRVAVDVDGLDDPGVLPAVFATAAVVLGSQRHLEDLGLTDVHDEVRDLAAAHGVTAVVTAGADGWWMTDGTATWDGPAVPVVTVDSTGAGDAFCGVFLAALDAGTSPVDAAGLAAAAAALSTTSRGARTTCSSRAEITAILRRRTETTAPIRRTHR